MEAPINDLVEELRDQFFGFVYLAQDTVIDVLGWVAEPAAFCQLVERFTRPTDA